MHFLCLMNLFSFLQGLLSVKWMAIEAIIQRIFAEKSDVSVSCDGAGICVLL